MSPRESSSIKVEATPSRSAVVRQPQLWRLAVPLSVGRLEAPARAVEGTPQAPATSSAAPTAPRRVLVIASRFPPVASVGATRVRKLVKHLDDCGWKAVVITGAMRRGSRTAQDARRAADYESLRDLPAGLPVYRLSPVLDNWPGYLARFVAKSLARFTEPLGVDEVRWSGLLKWRFQKLHDRLAFPDRGIWRLPSAVRLAVKLHRRHRFDAVFSSGMPFSDHLIGLAVHFAIRRPWLADFRDPWVEYVHWQQWQTDWGQRLTRWAEAEVVRQASRVISVNDPMTRRFAARYDGEPAGKWVTIPNGFDPEDFAGRAVPKPSNLFRLLYAGSLYKTRSPVGVLEAFRLFLDRVPGSRQYARFDFAGRLGPHQVEFAKPSDDGTIRHVGMLPHSAALRAMAAADVNVVILPNLPGGEGDTTAKVYECLGSGRAVLAAVPPGGAAEAVLRQHEGVWLCDPDDVEEMARTITEMYRRWLFGDLTPKRSPEKLEALTNRSHARDLAACLNALASRHGRGGGDKR